MNVLKRLSVVLSGVALCWFAQANVAQAQQAKTINILVGFPPGGSTDMVARVLADKLRVELNEPVVVENKPGAGGRVASLALKNSAPDGHTYLIMPNASAILNHLLYPTDVLGYDLLRDMTPVAMLVSGPIGLAINTKVTGVDTADTSSGYANRGKRACTEPLGKAAKLTLPGLHWAKRPTST